MTVRGSLVALALVAGCVRSEAVRCPDGTICPAGTSCWSFGALPLCVTAEQTAACASIRELGDCAAEDYAGTCHGGVCLPIGCGNLRIDDPRYGGTEECDDGNRIGHDGCSSTCQVERPRIGELVTELIAANCEHAMALDASRSTAMMFGGAGYGDGPPWPLFDSAGATWLGRYGTELAPIARAGSALASDAWRRQAVAFGGVRDGRYLDDTWEWNGTQWTPREPLVRPAPRAYHAMAYDPRRRVVVLFGGSNGASELGDTWEWDGEGWTEPPLALAPGPRSHHALVFDPARGVIVMVGERDGQVETWEYDGAWRAVVTVTRPSSARWAAVAYDGVERRVVSVGGEGADGTTWTFDGVTWTAHGPGVAPDGVVGAAATTSPEGRVVVFGGRPPGGAIDAAVASTWSWNGATWSDVSAPLLPPRPPQRVEHAVAFDPLRGRLVLFGGEYASSPVGDTWELGPMGWQQQGAGPSARYGHAMAHDLARRQVVLFGGRTAGTIHADTWVYADGGWTPIAPVGPLLRTQHAMVFDAARGEIVLFGGSTTPPPEVQPADTWIWNGSSWTSRSTLLSPSGRVSHAMAYDPIRSEVVLFGGRSVSGGQLGDTWIWDGQTWERRFPTASPEPREGHAMAWDAARQRIVLFGGARRDVWEWDGSSWRQVPLTYMRQSVRTIGAPALDGGGVLEIHQGPSGGQVVTRIRWDADSHYEACRAGDHDHDGLQGCEDPDCWAACTPTCPPGAACVADQPRCGDGTCTALETCHLCPQDCGACPVVCGDFVCAPGEDCPGDCPP